MVFLNQINMPLKPQEILSDREVQQGLKLVIGDGLAAEVMITFTSGAFLVAMALLMGATNFQIGLLASLPTFTNLFQFISIGLVRRYQNRRAVSVLCSILARIPLVVIGIIALTTDSSSSINLLILFLFFNNVFGSIAGPSWNSWMKDLVPENQLGSYFARRSRYTQVLNVALSLATAFAVDYVRKHSPENELSTYAVLFITAGLVGIGGAIVLSRVKEHKPVMSDENIFRLLKKPLRDGNFLRLLSFNSFWTFALSVSTPFFTVFLMKGMGLSLSYIIGLTIISQIASIFTVQAWGTFADRYSNKTIIAIGAPLYIMCIIAWCFVGIYSQFSANITLLVIIHIVSGIATAGINLSITNLGLKLAPKEDAIVYLTTRNMILSIFGAIGPLIGGQLADFFMNRSLTINATWMGAAKETVFPLIHLHEWNFLFLIGAALATIALELLVHVKEVGEVEKELVVRIMRTSIRSNLKDYFVIGTLIGWHETLWQLIKRKLMLR